MKEWNWWHKQNLLDALKKTSIIFLRAQPLRGPEVSKQEIKKNE